MRIKFDSNQDFQLKAIESVIKVFEGQPISKSDLEIDITDRYKSIEYTAKGVANKLVLEPHQLLANIKRIQKENCISLDKKKAKKGNKVLKEDNKEETGFPNITIEMETGTGKTYVFLRSIYELNAVYGFKKFVIVVPSVAIREGTLKNLEITHEHFQSLYNRPEIDFYVYDSKKTSILRSFATSNAIQILIINIDSFSKKEINIINQIRESGIKPIEFIREANPILILDEPQNLESDLRKQAISELNPMCAFRYSATHKDYYNLIYSLNPVKAYELGLVKHIEVDGITTEESYDGAYISFKSIIKKKNKIQAKLEIFVNEASGAKKKQLTFDVGDDLYQKSNQREEYRNGFVINSINTDFEELEFSNGILLAKGDVSGGLTDEIMKFQIERTIRTHFDKLRRNKAKGIKVLSLFFIDKVANYRSYNEEGEPVKGKFAIWFEELFSEIQNRPQYQGLIPFSVEGVHNGYFAQDKGRFKDSSTGTSKDDESTYNLIMKDKERLLSLDEPTSFIFSHSALREGWDNPNVFQICTLNETRSELKKRQEIGRGLRLPVNSEGFRVFDERVNILTVVANETYKDFAIALQKEIETETSVDFSGKIKDAKRKETIRLTKVLTPDRCPEFFELWDRIKQKTRYRVSFTTEDLIKKSLENIKHIPDVRKAMIKSTVAEVKLSSYEVGTRETSITMRELENIYYPIPDVYGYIQSRINVSRSTIKKIILNSGRLNSIRKNPQLFLDGIVQAITSAMNDLLVDGIKYEKIANNHYAMSLFTDGEIETYLSNLREVGSGLSADERQKAIDKTIYNYVPFDSDIERQFAKDCEIDDSVRFYFKLPRGFTIPTPLGTYNPDWALIFHNDNRIYFVAETKGTKNIEEITPSEKQKILCGKAHFKVLDNVSFQAPITKVSDLHGRG